MASRRAQRPSRRRRSVGAETFSVGVLLRLAVYSESQDACPPPEPITGDPVLLVNELVRLAVAQRASDIHLEPKHDMMQVRLRVDGSLVDVQPIANAVAPNVVSRVKVLAKMDIAERRMPQDGQIALEFEPGKRVHLRASTFPASQGEKLVLRILSGQQLTSFENLGIEQAGQVTLREVVSRPQGFIVTSGPTGAGKTSTLYALLQLIDPRSVNVVTLEDPIEVELYGVTQGQVNTRTGFTFASGLRAILRQDPDVILVGEIRDSETAGIAMQAALTGHLVLSTLHTSDTVETIVRLVDLGVEPWIVANALSAVLAQRLVRDHLPALPAARKARPRRLGRRSRSSRRPAPRSCAPQAATVACAPATAGARESSRSSSSTTRYASW